MKSTTCSHLTKRRESIEVGILFPIIDYLPNDPFKKRYPVLLKRIVFPSTESDATLKSSLLNFSCSQAAKTGECTECCNRLSAQMCCCFECATVGCIKDMRAHLKSKAHLLALSINFGELFCSKCNDFVYERKLERMRRDAQNAMRRHLGLSLGADWSHWPSRTETKLLRKNTVKVLQLGRNGTRGLRGLVNLGNSCFMSCILQTLLHIPLLRDYFLSDQHNCRCQSSASFNDCLMCELGHVFQEFYGGDASTPYVPHRMLHLVWTHAEHLAGYEQRDAHEFLISALNVLHKHSESISMQVNPHDCKCIIDRLFTGQLQSDLTCTRCGGVSTTVDPYWDISLELSERTPRQLLMSERGPENGGGLLSDVETPAAAPIVVERSLDECLENFVRPENLGFHSKTLCVNCGTYEVSTKQLTLKKLPIVACFHLKRFEHTSTARRQKIRDPVTYPELIDLTPYTTDAAISNAAGGGKGKKSSSTQQLSRLANRYSLIAVVNHNGTTESGHYSCFIRHQLKHWYQCDDQIISREGINNVLQSEGYLLFYLKQFLEYI